jgi:two-component system, chemotaxis family, chemotaxis protein CheY
VSKKRVLVVDDAVVMRMMLKDILSKNGFEVVGEAQNGADAAEKYKSLRPDVVTMDMVMPGVDGIGAVKLIVAEDPGAKIVMCTSMGQESLLQEAMDAGASAKVTKPFRPAEILEVINKVLDGAEA